MKDDANVDLLIVGAGPAGIGAALEAAGYGLSVCVLDDQPSPGGQIFRSVQRMAPRDLTFFGRSYSHGKSIVQAFSRSPIRTHSGATVWHADADGTVCFSVNGVSRRIRGKALLIAAGAMERPVPVPGWTLPGVMGATAVDVLMKTSAMAPHGRVVLAGAGPLMLLTANRLLRIGSNVAAVLDTTPRENFRKASAYLPKALRAWPVLLEGLLLLWRIRRSGIPVFRYTENVKADGHGRVENLAFETGGKRKRMAVDGLFLHEGVIPRTRLARYLGCELAWHTLQRYWFPVTNAWGESSVPGVYVAGDAAGIGGAVAAEAGGRLTALHIAWKRGAVTEIARDRAVVSLRKERAAALAVRPFLDALYRPALQTVVPSDNHTVVCRCEEVTAGQIRDAVGRGAVGPRQVKAYTRCGMGNCQGRMCGPTVAEIVARQTGTPVEAVGQDPVRPPLAPITLGELADLE